MIVIYNIIDCYQNQDCIYMFLIFKDNQVVKFTNYLFFDVFDNLFIFNKRI